MANKRGKKANNTRSSQAVSHPSTILAQCCLTSVIGRELVYSTWYGRWREKTENVPLLARSTEHALGPSLDSEQAVLELSPNKLASDGSI